MVGEKMQVICNIQLMQEKVYGKSFEYEKFNGNTIDELRQLQEDLIKEYNKSIIKIGGQ